MIPEQTAEELFLKLSDAEKEEYLIRLREIVNKRFPVPVLQEKAC